MTTPQALLFQDDPNDEHRQILQSKTRTGAAHWELGSRLLRFRQTGDWKQVTEGGPYDTWTDYLSRGVGLSLAQAKLYVRAAELPMQVTLRFGIEAAALLSTIVELTPEEESWEAAAELELEADDGKPKKFADMDMRERQRALARLRDRLDREAKGIQDTPQRQAAEALRDQLRSLATPQLQPEQIQARVVGGHPQVDLEAIPVAKAAELFAKLAEELKQR